MAAGANEQGRPCSDGIVRRFCLRCGIVLRDAEAEYCDVPSCVEVRGNLEIPQKATAELCFKREPGENYCDAHHRPYSECEDMEHLNFLDALKARVEELEGVLADLLAVAIDSVRAGYGNADNSYRMSLLTTIDRARNALLRKKP